mgnify:CR=1 FL=1
MIEIPGEQCKNIGLLWIDSHFRVIYDKTFFKIEFWAFSELPYEKNPRPDIGEKNTNATPTFTE